MTDDRDRGIRSYLWSRDSRRILYMQDAGGDENHHLCRSTPRRADRARDLTPFPGVRAGPDRRARATPRQVLVSMNLRDRSPFDAYRLTLANGRLELIGRTPATSSAGWPTARAACAPPTRRRRSATTRSSRATTRRTTCGSWPSSPTRTRARRTPSRRRPALWVGSARGCDLQRLVRARPGRAARERVVDRDDEVDLAGPIITTGPASCSAPPTCATAWCMLAFDERFRRDWEAVRGACTRGSAHQRAGRRRDRVDRGLRRRPRSRRDLPRRPRHGRRGVPLPLAPVARPRDPRPHAPVSDHLTGRAGAALAPDRAARRRGGAALPTVLYVHGGPWSRDAWGYDPQAQLLANRGYAVLQVNYRGSTGFGKAFTNAGEREWAGKMHDDLIDAVEWAVAEGIADRDRVGDLRRLATAGTPRSSARPSRPTCSPPRSTSSARRTSSRWSGPSRPTGARCWRAPGSATWATPTTRRPAGRPGGALAAQPGRRDPRAAAGDPGRQRPAGHQGRSRTRSWPPCASAACHVEYLVKDDEGHGFVKPENRMDAYGAIERFFAKHLGGRTAG